MSLQIIACKECGKQMEIIPMFMGDFVPNCRNEQCKNFDVRRWNNFKLIKTIGMNGKRYYPDGTISDD